MHTGIHKQNQIFNCITNLFPDLRYQNWNRYSILNPTRDNRQPSIGMHETIVFGRSGDGDKEPCETGQHFALQNDCSNAVQAKLFMVMEKNIP